MRMPGPPPEGCRWASEPSVLSPNRERRKGRWPLSTDPGRDCSALSEPGVPASIMMATAGKGWDHTRTSGASRFVGVQTGQSNKAFSGLVEAFDGFPPGLRWAPVRLLVDSRRLMSGSRSWFSGVPPCQKHSRLVGTTRPRTPRTPRTTNNLGGSCADRVPRQRVGRTPGVWPKVRRTDRLSVLPGGRGSPAPGVSSAVPRRCRVPCVLGANSPTAVVKSRRGN